MKINLNDCVKVRVTPYGEMILKERHEEVRDMMFSANRKDIGEFKLRLDEDGYYKNQLWSLLYKFEGCFNIGKLPVIENNEIIIVDREE